MALSKLTSVAKSVVSSKDSVQDLVGYTGLIQGQQVSLKGWHPDSDVGGGTLYWDAAKPKSDHNGASIFSPTVPYSATTGDYLDGVGETDVGGAGCWVMLDSSASTSINVYPLDGEVDFVKRLESLVSIYDEITCIGTFPINSKMQTIITNTKIKGIRGKTTFDLSNSSVAGEVFTLSDNAVFEGISFIGDTTVDPDFVFNSSDLYADTPDEVLSRKGEGTLTAIRMSRNSCKIDNCEFSYFSSFAVRTNANNSGAVAHGLSTGVTNSRFV